MMRLRRASVIALLLLAGCTSGSLIGALPTVPDPSLAANVVIVRPFSVFGSARRPTITIDGTDTYDIGPGEHVAIPVAPGERGVNGLLFLFVGGAKLIQLRVLPLDFHGNELRPR